MEAYDYIKSLGDLWGGNEYMATNLVYDMARKNGWTNEQIGAGLGFTPDQVAAHFAKWGYSGADTSPGTLAAGQGRAALSFQGPSPGTGQFSTGGTNTPSPSQTWTAETFGQAGGVNGAMAPPPAPATQGPATQTARQDAMQALLGLMPGGNTAAPPTAPPAPAPAPAPGAFNPGGFQPPQVAASDGWRQFMPSAAPQPNPGLLAQQMQEYPGLLAIMQRHGRA